MIFETESQRIKKNMKKHKSIFTDVPCALCGRPLTNNQLRFSIDKYGEGYCFSCQKLKSYE